MSGRVKDLREMIVASRLTCRDSDSDSDDGRAGMVTPFESLEITNDDVCRDNSTPTPPSSADSGLGRRKRKTKKPKGYRTAAKQTSPTLPKLHAFPKAKVLPAVGELSPQIDAGLGRTDSSSSGESIVAVNSQVTKTDFSEVISQMDESVVAHWLERSHQSLKDLTSWCSDTNFTSFAQFWITEFGVDRRREILALEYSILLDELTAAFSAGVSQGRVRMQDLTDFLSALLREYPKKLTGSAGVYLFLDYLDVFTSERAVEYRSILSDVRLSSRDKGHIQLILASRSFMLINVWMAIIHFYKQITGCAPTSTEHLSLHRSKADIHYSRLIVAINGGHVEVVHYFLYSGKISAGHVDARQKTLLHIATAANQPRVVEYLLKKWTGCMDVNRACDTGNSPLHVAVNINSFSLVDLLLNMPDIEVNIENSQCDGATPLHLAVLHGNIDIVRRLLQSRADPHKSMGGQNIVDIAKDFNHDDILNLLNSS